MEGMNLNSQLLLDISQWMKALNMSTVAFQKRMAQNTAAAARVGKQTGKVARTEQAHLKKTGKAIDKNTASWWKRFGAVALGFTVAYRAMNAFENGLTRVVMLIGDSIRVSGELASVQAKLAFWYQLHSKQMGNYNELYERAGVNTMALMEANLGAISTFEELATGLDEVAQTIGGIGPEWTKHLASVVDFTKLVAQTTGSTTRQIRQELQALMQGQIKTTDVMVRSLVRVGILSKKDIADLKAMTRQTEIFHHILEQVHSRWQEVAETIISTNVTIAMEKWQDHLKFMLIMGTQIASKYEGVGNIFAQVFVDHMKRIRKEMTNKDWTNTVLFIQNLAKGLDFLLKVFERVLYIIINVVASLGSFTKSVSTGFQLIKYAAMVMITYKAFSLLATMIALTVTRLGALAGLMGVKAVAGVATLDKAVKLLVARLFAVVLTLAAVGIAIKSFWNVANDAQNMQAWEDQKHFVDEQLKGIRKEYDKGEISLLEYIEHIRSAWKDAKKEVEVKGFFDYYAQNIKDGTSTIGAFLAEGMKNIWASLVEEPDIDQAKLKKAIADLQSLLDGTMKGLTSIADPVAEVNQKAIKAYVKSLASLTDQYDAYSETVIRLKTEELWWKDTAAIKEFQGSIIQLGKIEREHQELVATVGEEAAQMWLDMALLTRDARLEQERYLRNMHMMEELQISLSELTSTAHEHQLKLLDIEVENMRKTKGLTEELKKAIDAYYAERLIQIERDFNYMNELATRTADAMESAFSDLFFDILTQDFEDLEDLVTRVLNNIIRILSDVMANMLKVKMFGEQLGTGEFSGGWFWDMFKSGSTAPTDYGASAVPQHMHSGGLVGSTHGRHTNVPDWFSSYAPRLHSGLKADEYPAILQAGERVIPRGGSDDKVNVQINNYTGEKTKVKEDRNPYGGRDITVIIGEALSQDISNGGTLHQSIRRTFGVKPVTAGR